MSFDYTNAQLVANLSAILKEDFITNLIQNQYPRQTPLLSLLEKTSKGVSGEKAVVTMRVGPNTSTAHRAEMGALPDPGKQRFLKCEVPLANAYSSVCFSGQAIAASKNNATALASVVTDELDNAVQDHRKVENFYMFGDGSGFLAKVTGIDGNVITVDRWCPLFQVGRVLDSFTDKTGAVQHLSGIAITAVDRSAKTVTVSAIGTTAVNDYLFVSGSLGNVNMGLMGIVDNGTFVSTFQGKSRTTYPELKARVFGAGGVARNITEAILMGVVARQREDGVSPDLLIGTSFQLNDLCLEARTDRRFMDPKKKIALGIEGIEIGDGVTFTFDADCPAGYAFALTKKDLVHIESAPLGFMDKDGNVLSRIVGPRRDGYEATLFHYYNLAALACYSHARIEDLNENRYGD